MTDKEIIERVARLWIALGGDAKGLAYTWLKIKERIKELEDER